MTAAAPPRRPFWLAAPADPSADAETGGPPPARRTGPVLMGDIHMSIGPGSFGGRPLLLLLWEQWERDASEGDAAERDD